MTRVCFIGNSHLIMIQRAWPTYSATAPDISASFFAALVGRMDGLQVSDGKLIAGTPELAEQFNRSANGLLAIDPKEYDEFAIVGLRFGIRELYNALKEANVLRWSSNQDDRVQLISESFFRAWAIDLLSSSPAMVALEKLRSVTDKPVTLVPDPHPAETFTRKGNARHLPPRSSDFWPIVHQTFETAGEELGRQMEFEFLMPPESTFAAPGMTKASFAVGAVRFNGKDFGDENVAHMNADYGGEVLASFIRERSAAVDRS